MGAAGPSAADVGRRRGRGAGLWRDYGGSVGGVSGEGQAGNARPLGVVGWGSPRSYARILNMPLSFAGNPIRLAVGVADLTGGQVLRSQHVEAIRQLLVRERSFVILPSDTCYALAGVPVAKNLSARMNLILSRRPEPISLAFDSVQRVSKYVKLDSVALRLLEALTPGPLTLVCPLLDSIVPQLAHVVLDAPLRELGVRIPDSSLERQMVTACESPLTTVAIRDPRTAEPIRSLGRATDLVLAGLPRAREVGQIAVVESPFEFRAEHSTVVRVPASETGRGFEILRLGMVKEPELRAACNLFSQAEIIDFT